MGMPPLKHLLTAVCLLASTCANALPPGGLINAIACASAPRSVVVYCGGEQTCLETSRFCDGIIDCVNYWHPLVQDVVLASEEEVCALKTYAAFTVASQHTYGDTDLDAGVEKCAAVSVALGGVPYVVDGLTQRCRFFHPVAAGNATTSLDAALETLITPAPMAAVVLPVNDSAPGVNRRFTTAAVLSAVAAWDTQRSTLAVAAGLSSTACLAAGCERCLYLGDLCDGAAQCIRFTGGAARSAADAVPTTDEDFCRGWYAADVNLQLASTHAAVSTISLGADDATWLNCLRVALLVSQMVPPVFSWTPETSSCRVATTTAAAAAVSSALRGGVVTAAHPALSQTSFSAAVYLWGGPSGNFSAERLRHEIAAPGASKCVDLIQCNGRGTVVSATRGSWWAAPFAPCVCNCVVGWTGPSCETADGLHVTRTLTVGVSASIASALASVTTSALESALTSAAVSAGFTQVAFRQARLGPLVAAAPLFTASIDPSGGQLDVSQSVAVVSVPKLSSALLPGYPLFWSFHVARNPAAVAAGSVLPAADAAAALLSSTAFLAAATTAVASALGVASSSLRIGPAQSSALPKPLDGCFHEQTTYIGAGSVKLNCPPFVEATDITNVTAVVFHLRGMSLQSATISVATAAAISGTVSLAALTTAFKGSSGYATITVGANCVDASATFNAMSTASGCAVLTCAVALPAKMKRAGYTFVTAVNLTMTQTFNPAYSASSCTFGAEVLLQPSLPTSAVSLTTAQLASEPRASVAYVGAGGALVAIGLVGFVVAACLASPAKEAERPAPSNRGREPFSAERPGGDRTAAAVAAAGDEEEPVPARQREHRRLIAAGCAGTGGLVFVLVGSALVTSFAVLAATAPTTTISETTAGALLEVYLDANCDNATAAPLPTFVAFVPHATKCTMLRNVFSASGVVLFGKASCTNTSTSISFGKTRADCERAAPSTANNGGSTSCAAVGSLLSATQIAALPFLGALSASTSAQLRVYCTTSAAAELRMADVGTRFNPTMINLAAADAATTQVAATPVATPPVSSTARASVFRRRGGTDVSVSYLPSTQEPVSALAVAINATSAAWLQPRGVATLPVAAAVVQNSEFRSVAPNATALSLLQSAAWPNGTSGPQNSPLGTSAGLYAGAANLNPSTSSWPESSLDALRFAVVPPAAWLVKARNVSVFSPSSDWEATVSSNFRPAWNTMERLQTGSTSLGDGFTVTVWVKPTSATDGFIWALADTVESSERWSYPLSIARSSIRQRSTAWTVLNKTNLYTGLYLDAASRLAAVVFCDEDASTRATVVRAAYFDLSAFAAAAAVNLFNGAWHQIAVIVSRDETSIVRVSMVVDGTGNPSDGVATQCVPGLRGIVAPPTRGVGEALPTFSDLDYAEESLTLYIGHGQMSVAGATFDPSVQTLVNVQRRITSVAKGRASDVSYDLRFGLGVALIACGGACLVVALYWLFVDRAAASARVDHSSSIRGAEALKELQRAGLQALLEADITKRRDEFASSMTPFRPHVRYPGDIDYSTVVKLMGASPAAVNQLMLEVALQREAPDEALLFFYRVLFTNYYLTQPGESPPLSILNWNTLFLEAVGAVIAEADDVDDGTEANARTKMASVSHDKGTIPVCCGGVQLDRFLNPEEALAQFEHIQARSTARRGAAATADDGDGEQTPPFRRVISNAVASSTIDYGTDNAMTFWTFVTMIVVIVQVTAVYSHSIAYPLAYRSVYQGLFNVFLLDLAALSGGAVSHFGTFVFYSFFTLLVALGVGSALVADNVAFNAYVETYTHELEERDTPPRDAAALSDPQSGGVTMPFAMQPSRSMASAAFAMQSSMAPQEWNDDEEDGTQVCELLLYPTNIQMLLAVLSHRASLEAAKNAHLDEVYHGDYLSVELDDGKKLKVQRTRAGLVYHESRKAVDHLHGRSRLNSLWLATTLQTTTFPCGDARAACCAVDEHGKCGTSVGRMYVDLSAPEFAICSNHLRPRLKDFLLCGITGMAAAVRKAGLWWFVTSLSLRFLLVVGVPSMLLSVRVLVCHPELLCESDLCIVTSISGKSSMSAFIAAALVFLWGALAPLVLGAVMTTRQLALRRLPWPSTRQQRKKHAEDVDYAKRRSDDWEALGEPLFYPDSTDWNEFLITDPSPLYSVYYHCHPQSVAGACGHLIVAAIAVVLAVAPEAGTLPQLAATSAGAFAAVVSAFGPSVSRWPLLNSATRVAVAHHCVMLGLGRLAEVSDYWYGTSANVASLMIIVSAVAFALFVLNLLGALAGPAFERRRLNKQVEGLLAVLGTPPIVGVSYVWAGGFRHAWSKDVAKRFMSAGSSGKEGSSTAPAPAERRSSVKPST